MSEQKSVVIKRTEQVDNTQVISHDDYAYCIFCVEHVEDDENTVTNESNINFFKSEINNLRVSYERYDEYTDFVKEQGGNNDLETDHAECSILSKIFAVLIFFYPCYSAWKLFLRDKFEENGMHLKWFVDLNKSEKTVTYRTQYKLFEMITISVYFVLIIVLCMGIPSLVILNS